MICIRSIEVWAGLLLLGIDLLAMTTYRHPMGGLDFGAALETRKRVTSSMSPDRNKMERSEDGRDE